MSWRETFRKRLEKVVASKQLRLGNDAASKRIRLAMETDEERKAGLENMVALALIKGVVDVGAVLSLKPILTIWQLCLSFRASELIPCIFKNKIERMGDKTTTTDLSINPRL